MKTTSILARALLICIILMTCTGTPGSATASTVSTANPTCGEWKVEEQNGIDDQRMSAMFLEASDENCIGLFTVTNNTGIHKEDYLLGGSYTLQVRSVDDNATLQFETYLVPGLDNKIQASPDDFGKEALANLKGEMTWDTYTIDLAIFALKVGLEQISVPCVIPDDQLLLAAISASPVFASTATYLRNREFKRSIDEFKSALTLFYEKANITLTDYLGNAGVDCTFDIADELIDHILIGRVVLEYAARIPVIVFDLLKYRATSASVILIYTPSPSVALPMKKWIAFVNMNNIWLIHPDGSGLKQVTQNGIDEPRIDTYKWSPDGQSLAHSLRSDTGSAIFVYDVQTLVSQLIIKDDVGGGFDWSLNGKQILYETPFGPPDIFSNKGLWVFRLDNEKRRQILSASAMNPEWSTDGSYILYMNPGYEPTGYGVASFTSGRSTKLPLNPNGGLGAGNCQWAPTDLRIACITVSDNQPDVSELRILDINGNVLRTIKLPDRMEGNSQLHWSPDGERLSISYYEDSKAETDILDLINETYTYLATGIVSDWSADGNWILTWESGIDILPSISIVNVNSGEAIPLSEGMIAVWQP